MVVNKLKIPAVDDNQDNLISSETLTLLENLKLENAARRQSEEDLKRAQSFAKVGQWSHDLKTGKVQWSWLIYKALGLEFGDPRIDADALFLKSIHPDDRKQFHHLYAEPCPAVVEMDYRLVRQDGNITCIYSKGEISFDADRKPDKVFGVDQDVTENRQIQETLRESNDLNTSLLRTIPFGMDIVDESGNILFMSEKLQDIFGREAIGKKCWELYRDDKCQCVDCPLLTGINIGKTEIYETDGVMDGRTFQISHTGMLFQGRKAMLEIFQDITERKRGEKELIEAKENAEESNRLKSAFLNNMSHEIRTPMNAIMGFSDLMLEAKVDEKNAFAEIVHKSSVQLLMVIDDVMLLSRLQSEKLPANITGFRPAELITDVYRMFTLPELKRELALTVSIPVQYKNLVVRSDTDKIKQILTNLVSNAVKYTFNGGVDVGFDMRNGEIEFYVKDTGIGIPEDEQKRIFENFYRGVQVRNAAIGGTGLGLNIARELVELLGGRIGVSSMPGQGARFYFTIPAEQADELHSEKTLPVTVQKDWHNFTILIAEDDTDSYLYLELLLKNKVKRIDHATNGAKAVELALKNRYTLILMDLQMPVMDGIEATRKIKQHLSDIPVIAQTAYVSLMEKERALQSGFDDYISKPVKKTDLLAVINRVIKTEQKIIQVAVCPAQGE